MYVQLEFLKYSIGVIHILLSLVLLRLKKYQRKSYQFSSICLLNNHKRVRLAEKILAGELAKLLKQQKKSTLWPAI